MKPNLLKFFLPDRATYRASLFLFYIGHLGRRAWAARSAAQLHSGVYLRPEMTMGEVLDLAQDHRWTTPEFSQMLDLAGIAAFDGQFEQMTFREFVRYSASRKSGSA